LQQSRLLSWLFLVDLEFAEIWGLNRTSRRPRTPVESFSMSSAPPSASPTAVVKAPPQGGVLEGVNPVHFDAKNPIILFIIQVRRPLCFSLTMGVVGVKALAS
jgi:hypothetical protein